MSELLVLIDGNIAARVIADPSGRLSLEYESAWRRAPHSYSLSASMPLSANTFRHGPVWSHLWNLLPENPAVLQRWGQQYHVSAANPFKLLAHVGADVPGAAQFVTPERLPEIQAQRRPAIEWMTFDELRERVLRLRADFAAVRRQEDTGKMSLPGAQAKTAFYWDSKANRWGVPMGRTPTTHIIKPCVPGFEGLVENEHLCQDIAGRVGLPAAKSFVLELDEPCIVVERYDRLHVSRGSLSVERIHQEDVCQALGLMPTKKYQEDGGPGIAQIVTLMRRVSAQPELDVQRFLQANMFNWLIGGTDAHAKNYSLLIGAGDEVRLAPLYDLSSQLPYPGVIAQRVAMKLGEHYDIARVKVTDWQFVARACAVDEDWVIATLTEMARALADEISAARAQALMDGLAGKILTPLAEQMTRHVRERLRSITAPVTATRGSPAARI